MKQEASDRARYSMNHARQNEWLAATDRQGCSHCWGTPAKPRLEDRLGACHSLHGSSPLTSLMFTPYYHINQPQFIIGGVFPSNSDASPLKGAEQQVLQSATLACPKLLAGGKGSQRVLQSPGGPPARSKRPLATAISEVSGIRH